MDDNVKDIKENLRGLFRDHIRLYSLKGIEKSSLFLGVIATFFIVLIFFIMGIIFASLALSKYLNALLDNAYLGYLLVGAGDVLVAVLLLVLVQRTRVPLLTSLFVKILVNIFKIEEDEDQ